ncbi:TPA: hypothetical protein L4559_003551 [Pseudomonas aeruginosa]|nr:hypothetical protein [Pseudomonas aeruginosa]
MHTFTNDQIEADVSAALAGYKLALIRTGYNSETGNDRLLKHLTKAFAA